MSQIEQWIETTFLPWKQEMKAYKAARQESLVRLRRESKALQSVVGDLLSGKTREAVQAWNALGMVPALKDVGLDYGTDTLTFVPVDGQKIQMKVDDLLQELETLTNKVA